MESTHDDGFVSSILIFIPSFFFYYTGGPKVQCKTKAIFSLLLISEELF